LLILNGARLARAFGAWPNPSGAAPFVEIFSLFSFAIAEKVGFLDREIPMESESVVRRLLC
jgi:hypothetical protein